MEAVPGEIEGTTTRTIKETEDTFEIHDVLEIKAAPPFFLEIAGQVRAARDELKTKFDKMEDLKKDLQETEDELTKFKPFIDQASLIKKKAAFREQRKRK